MTSYQFDARLTYNNELLFKTCNTEIIKKKKIFLFPKLVIMMVHICDGCYFNSNFFFFSYFQEWEKLEGKKVSLFPKQLYKWGMLKSIQAQIWLVCVSSEKSGYHAEWSKVFKFQSGREYLSANLLWLYGWKNYFNGHEIYLKSPTKLRMITFLIQSKWIVHIIQKYILIYLTLSHENDLYAA